MRALLITLDGIQEVQIGYEIEQTIALVENRSPVERDRANLQSMYRLIGCDAVTGAGYPDAKHACWADDDGLAFLGDGAQVNIVSWYPDYLVGKLLVTGFDFDTGETTEATMSVEELSSMVKVGVLGVRNVEGDGDD